MSNTSQAMIFESELNFITKCVKDYPNLETGGDFFGAWSAKGNLVVHFATGPGEETRRSQASFFQDIDYLKKCGNLLYQEFGLKHIGAWHSHHCMSIHEPSSGDINTMQNTFRTNNLSKFLIAICNIDGDSSVSIKGFEFVKSNLGKYNNCEFISLNVKSPVRHFIEKNNPDIATPSRSDSYTGNVRKYELAKSAFQEAEKPDLDDNSYWKKDEGREYLRNVVEKLKNRNDISDVEILQLSDKRIAVSFVFDGDSYEIRFPNNFPHETPEIEKVYQNMEQLDSIPKVKSWSWRKKSSDVRDIVSSLRLYLAGKEVVIKWVGQ
jgi:hypothetical protein